HLLVQQFHLARGGQDLFLFGQNRGLGRRKGRILLGRTLGGLGPGGGKQRQRLLRSLAFLFQRQGHGRKLGVGVGQPLAQRLQRGRIGEARGFSLGHLCLRRRQRRGLLRALRPFLCQQRLQRVPAGGGKAGGLGIRVHLV